MPTTASIPAGRLLTVNAVILDSLCQRGLGFALALGGLAGDNRPQPPQWSPTDHDPRREPRGFRQSVRTSPHLDAINRKISADTGLAEVGVRNRSVKYEVYGRIGADTLAK